MSMLGKSALWNCLLCLIIRVPKTGTWHSCCRIYLWLFFCLLWGVPMKHPHMSLKLNTDPFHPSKLLKSCDYSWLEARVRQCQISARHLFKIPMIKLVKKTSLFGSIKSCLSFRHQWKFPNLSLYALINMDFFLFSGEYHLKMQPQ